jgi:putative Mg2+ transporter-C (MgtC) family protein
MITEMDIIVRLLVAAVLGGLVGFERERNNQPAGLRTHIILVVGAALAMTLSINIAMEFRPLVPNGDPARLAAQVISGIGFLGVGAIIRYGPNVKGLTTATSMWSMAIIGLAVGSGYFLILIFATLLLLVTLIVINEIEKRFIKHRITSQLSITTVERRDMLNKLRLVIDKHASIDPGLSIQKDFQHKRSKYVMTFKLNKGETIDNLLSDINEIEGIRSIKLE